MELSKEDRLDLAIDWFMDDFDRGGEGNLLKRGIAAGFSEEELDKAVVGMLAWLWSLLLLAWPCRLLQGAMEMNDG